MALPSGRYEYMSAGITALTGYSPEEFDATPGLIQALMHPDWRDYFETAWSRLLEGEMPPVYEYAIIDRAGNTRWLRQENVLIRDREGCPCAIEGVVFDVTSHRRAAAELERRLREETAELERTTRALRARAEAHAEAQAGLRDREEQLRLLTDNLPAAISYVDAEERYRFNNRTYQDWFGHAPREIYGKTLREVLGDAAYGSIAEHVRMVLDGEQVSFESEIPYARGGTRFVRASYVPHRDEACSRAKGFFALIADVTEAKRAEASEQRHLDELAHADRLASIGEMASELTHELTQPLAAIANYGEACLKLLEHGQASAAIAHAKAIRDQSRQALDTVNHLRRLARRRTAEKVPTDMGALVQGALDLVRREAAARGFSISLDAGPPAPAVCLDPVLMEQVILNLVRNAMDASTDVPDATLIELNLTRRDGRLQLAVSDRGMGLAATGKARVFEPFFTTKKSGLGLGLVICKRILESHGGRLWAEDNPGGRGTVFFLELPTEEDRA